MKFLDRAKIFIQSGNGGAGAVSFRREANVPRGGPDGGDGGVGGNVTAICVDSLNTLVDYRYRQHFKATTGGHGAGRNRTGARGSDVVLKLPRGTQILTDDKSAILADLTEIGQEAMLAMGGSGGRGNAHFKSATNQAPRRAETGEEGTGMWVWLQLKLIADVGLIGLPNAGKSSFLASVSSARPKIADYPFTTLHPQLGVVMHAGDEFVVADMPGLIKDAHKGVGLGHRFLQHSERCHVLLHLVDATTANPVADWQTIQKELTAYGEELPPNIKSRQVITALTKADASDGKRLTELTHALKKVGAGEVAVISSLAKTGLDALLGRLIKLVAQTHTPQTKSATAPYDSLHATKYHSRLASP
ncbi:MAG: GTPase ObgE [Proteobacteria bacterium]|nr:GTPase ObgE [Pseudomonadota bacterium]